MTFYFHSAYLDIREKSRLGPAIRIQGMVKKKINMEDLHCNIWYNNTEEGVVSKIVEFEYTVTSNNMSSKAANYFILDHGEEK